MRGMKYGLMRYGCFNTERVNWFYARNHEPSDSWLLPPKDYFCDVRDTSTTDCQYRKTTPDPKCEGCTK